MKVKKIGISILLIFVISFSFAQQAVFSQYFFNPVFTNPAFTGNEYKLNVNAQYKMMWTGVTSSPSTALITAHSPVGLSASSLGISVLNDNFGITSTTGATLYYAYRFQTKAGRISAGTQLSFENFKQDLTGAVATNINDPILVSDVNLFLFNVGFGIAWENEKGYFGISSPAILNNSLSETNKSETSSTLVQYNLTGAYTLLLNSKWKITPSVLYKYVETLPTQLDIQVHLLYHEQLQFDAGFRTNTTYIAGISYKLLNGFQIGYCYDLDNSSFGSSTGGSHEILLGYTFNKNQSE